MVARARRAGLRRGVGDARRSWPALWLAAMVLCTAGLVVLRYRSGPDWLAPAVSTVFAGLLAWGLCVRAGGRPRLPVALVLLFGAAATITLEPVLLAAGATGASVLAATLALMGTVPAATFARTVVEVVLAAALATVGGLAVAGFDTALRVTRFEYVVLAVSLIAALGLVYRLGAGFHGLGRRGYVVAGGALLLLALALVYSAALERWGSPEVVGTIDDLRGWLRDELHAVPHPIETLLGVPALCWGVFMRARRRQGWWVCAFGAAATAPATTRFVEVGVPTATTVLGAAYTLILGLLLGYVVIRIEQTFTGSRGRRARRREEASAHRPEPGRFAPLQ